MVSMLSAVRDLARLREISSVLVRPGFGEVVARAGLGRTKKREKDRPAPGDEAEPPEIAPDEIARGEDAKRKISNYVRARLVLQDLGPSFIKLGQIASTRADVLPPAFIAELKKLQDDVPAVPFEKVKTMVGASLGARLSELYVSFEDKPLATASIGPGHGAGLAT